MWRNIIDGSLLISIFALGAMVFRERIAQIPLDQDIERISQFLGEMPITDPKKAYFKALPSNRPHEYMWRVYLPRGLHLRHEVNYDGAGGSGGGALQVQAEPGREFVFKVRLGFNSDFFTHGVFAEGGSSSSFIRIGPELLSEHKLLADPKIAIINQSATEKAIEFDDEGNLKLLSVSLPIKGQPELKEMISVEVSTDDPIKLNPRQ